MKDNKLDLPPLYAITDTRLSGLSHTKQVVGLIRGGARLIQIRDKQATADELYRASVECVAFARPLGVKIIINDRADVALAADADGVHLGQDDLPPDEARALLGGSRIVGISTHNLEQAIRGATLPVDYVAVGPAFLTSSKANPDPTVGVGLIALVKTLVAKPIVAIGGITLERAQAVIQAGADSVAVISDLYSTDDIAARVAEFLRLLAP